MEVTGPRCNEQRVCVGVVRSRPDLAGVNFVRNTAVTAIGNPIRAYDAVIDTYGRQIIVAADLPLGIPVNDRVCDEVLDQCAAHAAPLVLGLDAPCIARDGGVVDMNLSM